MSESSSTRAALRDLRIRSPRVKAAAAKARHDHDTASNALTALRDLMAASVVTEKMTHRERQLQKSVDRFAKDSARLSDLVACLEAKERDLAEGK